MIIETLEQIIATNDNGNITKQLCQLGYADCRKDKGKLGNVDITDLFSGNMQSVIYREYKGTIITNVDGYKNYEFVVIVDKKKSMLIFAKRNDFGVLV